MAGETRPAGPMTEMDRREAVGGGRKRQQTDGRVTQPAASKWPIEGSDRGEVRVVHKAQPEEETDDCSHAIIKLLGEETCQENDGGASGAAVSRPGRWRKIEGW